MNMQSFLGLTGYYRKFIKNYASIVEPMTNLLKKNIEFEWTDAQQKAFETLKGKITSAPVLAYIDPTKMFQLETDASETILGAVLSQEGRPNAFISKKLKGAELNYSTIEKEAMAIIWAIEYFDHYLYGRKFRILTDHKPLQYIMNKTGELRNKKIARWFTKLAEYDKEIAYRPGKQNGNADALSRMLQEETIEPENETKRKTEDEKKIKKQEKIRKEKNKKIIRKDRPKDIRLTDDRKKDIARIFAIMDSVLEDKEDDEDEGMEIDTETNDLTQTDPEEIELEKDKKEIIEENHKNRISGHRGVKATIHRIKEQIREDIFKWKGLRKDVEKYIRNCRECQVNKLLSNKKQPMLITDTPREPMEKGYLDIYGPLPETERGNKYLLTYMDGLSRFTCIIPLKNQEAETVAEAFCTEIVLKGPGIPKVLLTDQGTNFLSRFFRSLCRLLEIEKIQTTAFHPESNGALERSHRQLGEFLRHYIDKDQTNWDVLAPFAQFCHNTSKCRTTGHTPYEVLFGRKPEIPSALKLPTKVNYTYDDLISEIKNNFRSIYDSARQNLEQSKQETKEQCDKKTKIKNFKIGDTVVLRNQNARPGRSKKLEELWNEPYKVLEKINEVNYKIKKGRHEQVVHANRLKPFEEL
jgi:transposase InsO family protein